MRMNQNSRSLRRLGPSLWLAIMTLAGCGGLQEMWEGPAAKGFHPKSIAILQLAGPYDAAREDVEEVLAAALMRSNKFERVVPPEEVTDIFQATKDAFDALVVYFTKMETTGQSDKQAAVKIGQALKADALLVVKVNAWEYTRQDGDNIAKVGLGLRLVDAATGAIVWKARHQVVKSYIFFRPNMKEVAMELGQEMIRFMPPERR